MNLITEENFYEMKNLLFDIEKKRASYSYIVL
jgi:hypothetical protein